MRRLFHKVRTSFCPQDAARQFRQRMVFGLVFLCCLGMARVVSSEELIWTSHGPGGGNVLALAIDPSAPGTVYAGTNGGVFKSINGGASWSAFNDQSQLVLWCETQAEYMTLDGSVATLVYPMLVGW